MRRIERDLEKDLHVRVAVVIGTPSAVKSTHEVRGVVGDSIHGYTVLPIAPKGIVQCSIGAP
jgi:predicted CoA-binding protein